MPPRRDVPLILAITAGLALISARPYAAGWNDGSRLAAVESLADRGTFAIDDSIFVRVFPDTSPYLPGSDAERTGTLDKLRIRDHWYSDKSPVPTLLLAGVHRVMRCVSGVSACESPTSFCWFMNLLGAGFPYAVSVMCVYLMSVRLSMTRATTWIITLGFACATIAPAYARHVNNHIMLLGVVAAIGLLMLPRPHVSNSDRRWFALGTLTGFGYTIDLGIGPFLLVAIGAWVIHGGSARRLAVFTLAALPWLVVHHVINNAIAGTFGPANARPEFLDWPGSPFDVSHMTGRWHHSSLSELIAYSLDLLVGQHGILGHNLPMYLGLAGAAWLWFRGIDRPLIIALMAWSAGGFLAYAVTSNNYSGYSLSVRWFVPMLGPGFLFILLALRHRPEWRTDFVILSSANLPWAIAGWLHGPFDRPPVLLYWLTMGGGLLAWGAWALRRGNWRSPLTNVQAHHFPLQFPQSHANNTMNAPSETHCRESRHAAVEEGRRPVR